jgi:hypothetical protein
MYFFFSYARADDSKFLRQFYDDLLECVRNEVGAATVDEVAFRDARSIEPGTPWPEALAEALQSAKVFVYLHTPTFYGREGCGREWAVVKQRLLQTGIIDLRQASAIQPVYWSGPLLNDRCPPEIERIQLTHENYGEIYNRKGLLHLVRTAFNGAEYWEAVPALAQRIADAARNAPLQPLPQRPVWEQIAPLFPAAGNQPDAPRNLRSPRHARFVWIVGTRAELAQFRDVDPYDPDDVPEDWRPFLPACTDPGRLICR